MDLDDEFLKRVSEALSTGRPVTAEDLLERYPLVITVNERGTGYANPRVTAALDGMTTTELTHLKLIPMKEDGYLIIAPAAMGTDGAVEFNRSGSRRTGTCNMRMALGAFGIDFTQGRKLRFPVTTAVVTTQDNQRTVVLMRVKKPGSKRTRSREPKPPTDPAPGTGA